MPPFGFRLSRFKKKRASPSPSNQHPSPPENIQQRLDENQLSTDFVRSSADLPSLHLPPPDAFPVENHPYGHLSKHPAPPQLPEDSTPGQHYSSSPFESIGMFSKAHNIVIYDSQFIDQSNTSYDFLAELLQYTIIGAEYDSSDRYPPPRCHPGTRFIIVERCKAFITQSDGKEKMCWVVGPAGVGKSAIMQIVAEGTPADAAVFLSVNGRRDGTKIIVTIAYQLAIKFEPYRRFIQDQINLDPSLPKKSLSRQFNKFIAEPFMLSNLFDPSRRFLIIIDGLDECDNALTQRELLELISDFCITHPASPFAWLIASRPEPHIVSYFNDIYPASVYTRQEIFVDSHDASDDVQRYLRDELYEIKCAHPTLRRKQRWPSESDFTKIATAAGGLFAFASIVVQYISDRHSRDPVSQLRKVLIAVDPGAKDDTSRSNNPFAMLDVMYERILSNIPDEVMFNTRKLLLIHSNDSKREANFRLQCNRLGLMEDDAYEAVSYLHAVAKIPTPNKADDERLLYYHHSFLDFLCDVHRSAFRRDEAEQLQLQTSLRIVGEVSDDDDMVGSNLGAYGYLSGGESSCNCVSLSWPGDERFTKTDRELRLELYHDAMLDICIGFSSRTEAFRSLPCFHALTTHFTTLGPQFPYYQVRESIFDNFRHELTKLGELRQVPLRTLDYAAIGGVIDLQFTSSAEIGVHCFDPRDIACEHGKEEQRRGWSTSFQKSDMATDKVSHRHAYDEHPPDNRCDHCSQRLARHFIDNPEQLASVFVDSTELAYVEFSITDPGDGMSEWRYRLLHSGRPFDKS